MPIMNNLETSAPELTIPDILPVAKMNEKCFYVHLAVGSGMRDKFDPISQPKLFHILQSEFYTVPGIIYVSL
jgi:hypothetical protein